MSDRIQANLVAKAKEHTQLQLLVSQWSFDQELIPKALQNIGSLFPHYSRHDHSHSKQILVNIERILGDSVFELSATDSWLLLEAAYWHDIGMVVPSDAINEALASEEFQQYLQGLRLSTGHELQEFAKNFHTSDVTKTFSGAASPLDAIEKFRAVMAEWFRKQHPSRAGKIVENPWDRIGLSSPRTELIPARLFRLLGSVCTMHGAPFDEVMDELPFREAGLSNDNCHPRFVAYMLRLGDLLDLDDNRFCPVMQRIAGENRPSLSKAHEDKHASIRHFRLDRERIEISAECKTIDGYLEQWRWLDWLRDEVRQQMARWVDIAPTRAFGLLPALGKIEVSIEGRQFIPNAGERPEFTLDQGKVMELLQGANLYKREDAIREILQNAVDATLLQIWRTQRSKLTEENWQRPDSEDVQRILNAAAIEVALERVDGHASDAANLSRWRLTVKDQGTGISLEDLQYMMRVGGSSRNLKRQALLDSMPEWMKPSGTFGIGFQSIFMWTEEVTLNTKSLDKNDALQITFHSPTGGKNGLVVIERQAEKPELSIGTELQLEFTTDKLATRYSISHGEKSLKAQFSKAFDPLLDDELPIDAIKIADSIFNFSLKSPIKINGNFSDGDDDIALSKDSVDSKNSLTYLPRVGCFFGLRLVEESRMNRHRSRLYYRGQPVEADKGGQLPSVPFVEYDLDITRSKASTWLTFDRNQVRRSATNELEKLIFACIKEWFTDTEKINRLTPTEIPCFSALAITLKEIEQPEELIFWQGILTNHKMSDSWKNLFVETIPEEKSKSVQILDLLKIGNMVAESSDHPRHTQQFGKAVAYELPSHQVGFLSYPLDILCLLNWCETPSQSIAYSVWNERVVPRLVEKTSGLPLFDLLALRKQLESSLNGWWTKRFIVPCMADTALGKFSDLALTGKWKLTVGRLFEYAPPETPQLILPFFFCDSDFGSYSVTTERLDELVLKLKPHIADGKLSASQLRTRFEALISYIDNDVMKESSKWHKARQLNPPANEHPDSTAILKPSSPPSAPDSP